MAACIGNVLEWYDFAIYGGFAKEFGVIFFPPCGLEADGFDGYPDAFTPDQADGVCAAASAGRMDMCNQTHCCAWDAEAVAPVAGLGTCTFEPRDIAQGRFTAANCTSTGGKSDVASSRCIYPPQADMTVDDCTAANGGKARWEANAGSCRYDIEDPNNLLQ
eukprot:SAG22_NODE_4974_length_1118_cov_2.006869_1_plen_161_part_10